MEFHWFPLRQQGAGQAEQPAARRRPGAKPLSPLRQFVEYELLENVHSALMSRLGRAVPRLVRPLNRTVDAVLSARTYTDVSHRVFVTTPRRVRFVESEYAIPRESLLDVLAELRRRSRGCPIR